jgi:NADH dehydrogenase
MIPSNATTITGGDAAPSSRVLILGGGYGGVRAAHELGKYLHTPDDPALALIDNHPYHQIITELPHAVTGRRSGADLEYALDELLARSRVRIMQTDIQSIDAAHQLVTTADGAISYGTLLIALGSTTAFYGIPGLQEHALTFKSVEDAQVIKNRVLQAIQSAAGETNPARRAALLTIIVGGGGLTGVELAGALAEAVPHLARERGLPPQEPKIVLVEASPTILPTLPARLQFKALRLLEDLGVRPYLHTRVAGADEQGLTIEPGGRIEASTVIWAGGIKAPTLLMQSGLPTARSGQVLVNEYLRALGQPDIYAVGDCAWIIGDGSARHVGWTAQNTLDEASSAAYNIFAARRGYPARPFHAHDKGQVVSIGPKWGVAFIFGLQFTGRKVAPLKEIIEEGYRYELTRHLPFVQDRVAQ